MKIRLFSGPGTRQWPRFNISDVPSIYKVKSAAGSRINVVDISRGGTLLLTPRRLVPGTRIRLNIETSEGNTPITGLVLRSSDFYSEGGLKYQAAVVFDRLLRIPDDSLKPKESTLRAVAYNQREDTSTIADFFLATDFCNEQSAIMPEMLRLNDW